MKKSILMLAAGLLALLGSSCKNSGNGQLVGVQERPEYVEVVPLA